MLDPNKPKGLESIKKCRSITNEILNFGVSQDEIKKLIELLSLELEDTSVMKKIVTEVTNKQEEEKLII